MKTKEKNPTKKKKLYSEKETPKQEEKKNIVEEPMAIYGDIKLDLDETKRYTYADYLTWADDKRRELYDGFIQLMSGPNRMHGQISGYIFTRVWNHIDRRKSRKCRVYHAPFDVRLPKNGETADDKIYTVLQPDICVICNPSRLDDKGCIGAPDLVVEVLSPSTLKRDLHDKLRLYEEAGVREYWVVSPKENAVTVFLLHPDGKFDAGKAYEYDAKVPVRIFDNLEIPLKKLFED